VSTQRYRQTAIEFLVLTKLFAVAVVIGNIHPALPRSFISWNTLLTIIFSFVSTGSWMLAGWKSGQETRSQ
jgi:uncharacterized protein YqgC (DUF456 family)